MANAGSGPRPLSGVYVLFVDDNVDAREIIKGSLEYHGALVRTAPSAHDGLDMFRRAIPDVVITDLSMPSRDGIWLLHEIRKHPRGAVIPVIALTAHGGWYAEAAMLGEGFDAYVTKPISSETLCRLVARFVGR